MDARIAIRHLAGSKVNQVEQFPLDAVSELTIGRETGLSIQFDPLRDDAVSRRHAKIAVEPGDPPRFTITDLGSRNGTFLNGDRIPGPTEVLPGDTVELGSGGPKFEFDVQPRPANLFGRTRAIPAAAASTRVVDNFENEPPPTAALPVIGMRSIEPPPKRGIGRDTLLHELSAQRLATRQLLVYGAIGVLVVIGAVGGALYYSHQKSIAEQNARIAQERVRLDEQSAKAQQSAAMINARIENKIGLTPQEIAEKYDDATVKVKVSWRVYDSQTNRPIYHKAFRVKNQNGGDEWLPAYVRSRGKLFRWLTFDPHSSYSIGTDWEGSGFVVDSQGLILTNRHVVEAGMRDYHTVASYERQGERGVVYNELPQDASVSEKSKALHDLRTFTMGTGDVADEGGPLFSDSLPIAIGSAAQAFVGRNEKLSVRFRGTRTDINAQLLRVSPDADVALIKIDAFQTAAHDLLADDDKVSIGEPVVVLGYPGASVENKAIFDTIENGQVQPHDETIPEPTVSSGVISMKGVPLTKEGNVTLYSQLGEVYQMTVSTIAGASGGPVFDHEGRVIGLYTYSSEHETQSYAVPIKYARQLMQLQRVN